MAEFEFTLPSGRVVMMRYPDLYELVFDETIPDPLTGIVEGLITKTMTARGMATEAQQKAGDAMYEKITEADTGVQFVQLIVERCMVTPRIATTFEEGRKLKAEGVEVLHIGQLDEADVLAIYYSAMGVTSMLEALFHRKKSPDVPVELVPDVPPDEPVGVESAERAIEPALDTVHG